MSASIDFQPMPGLPHTRRVVALDPSPAVIGFVRTTPSGYFVARTVGTHIESADIRQFPTRDGATRWLLSSGQRRRSA